MIKKILECAKFLDFKNIDTKDLFSSEIDKISSKISSKKYLRDALKIYQKNFPYKYAEGKRFV